MPDKSVRDLQAEIAGAVESGGGIWPPLANLARLMEEVGELARLLNQKYGAKQLKVGESRKEISEELGDVMFPLICLAQSENVDLQSAVEEALIRFRKRS